MLLNNFGQHALAPKHGDVMLRSLHWHLKYKQ